MANINWGVFVGVGLVVTVSSYFTDMWAFVIIGIIMFAYGLFKFLLTRLRTPKHSSYDEHRKKLEEKARQRDVMMQKQKAMRRNPQQTQNYYKQQPKFHVCPNCRKHIALGSNFCNHCGFRVR